MIFRTLLVVSLLYHTCLAWEGGWDNEDFELFDLVEEVKENFYTLLGIDQSASTADVRRAYRKLSLQLHPDRNDAEDAEEKFRQLVAVYETIKDKNKREKYDRVLVEGLPEGRLFNMYRKYRKMGMAEILACISLIIIVGHYIFRWTAYLEKKFELDEVLEPIRKKMMKKKAKGKQVDEEEFSVDFVLEQQYGYTRPTLWDLLPFVLFRGTRSLVVGIPERWRASRERKRRKEEREREEEEERMREEEEAMEEKVARESRVKRKPPPKIRDISEMTDTIDQDYKPASQLLENEFDDDSQVDNRKDLEWTDEDFAALAKMMAKFPGGTPGRWDRIAHELGRATNEIMVKVKQMKVSLAKNNMPLSASSVEAVTTKKKPAVNISDSVMTKAIGEELGKTSIFSDSMTQDDIPDDYDQGTTQEEPPVEYAEVRKRKVKTRPVDETKQDTTAVGDDTASDSQPSGETSSTTEKNSTKDSEGGDNQWSQVQQKCLEGAIAQFPKSTQDRWTCIARVVPGKNKEECVTRYKLLVEHIKQKKTLKGS